MAMLWDVATVVEANDSDNPTVAVSDVVALTPSPGSLASWPSLYKTLSEIVRQHGVVVESVDECTSGANYEILLSKAKPLLQKHWHIRFDESGLSYITQEGLTMKLKK